MSTHGVVIELTAAVQAELDAFVDRQRTRLADLGPELAPLVDAAQAYVSGGKHLRPAFCYWGWRAAGGDPDSAGIVRAASSLEWLQASALVHDDVMDRSEEHTSELQSRGHLVCRLLLEKKKKIS